MRPVIWKRLFWATILPTTAGVLALAGWLLFQNRYNIEVWWYRQHLAEAKTFDEAEPWQKKLWEPSARQARWTAATRTFMQGESWADFWMLNGRYTDDSATYYGGFLAESRRRPEICRAMVYTRRWATRGKRWTDGSDAGQPIDLLAELQGIMETPLSYTNPNRSPGEYTWTVRVLCWCTYQDDLCRDLDFENWSEAYTRWKWWLAKNGPYLRFEPDTDRFRLDVEAKHNRQPVPRESQLAQSVDTPLPGWQGPLPQ